MQASLFTDTSRQLWYTLYCDALMTSQFTYLERKTVNSQIKYLNIGSILIHLLIKSNFLSFVTTQNIFRICRFQDVIVIISQKILIRAHFLGSGFPHLGLLPLTHRGRVTHICVGNLSNLWSCHYLNQCWLAVNCTLMNKLKWVRFQHFHLKLSTAVWKSSQNKDPFFSTQRHSHFNQDRPVL